MVRVNGGMRNVQVFLPIVDLPDTVFLSGTRSTRYKLGVFIHNDCNECPVRDPSYYEYQVQLVLRAPSTFVNRINDYRVSEVQRICTLHISYTYKLYEYVIRIVVFMTLLTV